VVVVPVVVLLLLLLVVVKSVVAAAVAAATTIVMQVLPATSKLPAKTVTSTLAAGAPMKVVVRKDTALGRWAIKPCIGDWSGYDSCRRS
jgi:hypothetical protein